jgi:cell division protein FtsB
MEEALKNTAEALAELRHQLEALADVLSSTRNEVVKLRRRIAELEQGGTVC